jgi:hypothetical protein
MFPWKDFFDEMDQENSKKQEGKNGGNENKRFFLIFFGKVPRTRVFPTGWECPHVTALVRPSLRRTHSYGNPPYNIASKK